MRKSKRLEAELTIVRLERDFYKAEVWRVEQWAKASAEAKRDELVKTIGDETRTSGSPSSLVSGSLSPCCQ